MKRILVILALPLLLLTGCMSGPSEEEQKEALEKTVMDVHDEAMAKMGTIHQLRRQLQHLQDSLKTKTADTATTGLVRQNVAALDKADEAMMSWMHQYKTPDTLQHEQAMQYLQEQKTKIDQVQSQMDSSIAAARELARKYETQ